MKNATPRSEFVTRPLPSLLVGLILLTSFTASNQAHAIMIQADLTNLADTLPGQDSWRASYTISGTSFTLNQGFTILFDPLLYSNLSAPVPPVSPTWDLLTIQPDVLLNAPGFLDGLALVNNPSLSQPFVLDFIWLGAALPGSQAFELYDQNGTFQIIGSGQTVVGSIDTGGGGSTVPDSGSTVLLLGVSISGILLGGKRLLRRSVP